MSCHTNDDIHAFEAVNRFKFVECLQKYNVLHKLISDTKGIVKINN
jgi:hypothetical protein